MASPAHDVVRQRPRLNSARDVSPSQTVSAIIAKQLSGRCRTLETAGDIDRSNPIGTHRVPARKRAEEGTICYASGLNPSRKGGHGAQNRIVYIRKIDCAPVTVRVRLTHTEVDSHPARCERKVVDIKGRELRSTQSRRPPYEDYRTIAKVLQARCVYGIDENMQVIRR